MGPVKKIAVFARDKFQCFYCKSRDNLLTIDHIIPISRFSLEHTKSDEKNIITACRGCNHNRKNIKIERFILKKRQLVRNISLSELEMHVKQPIKFNGAEVIYRLYLREKIQQLRLEGIYNPVGQAILEYGANRLYIEYNNLFL